MKRRRAEVTHELVRQLFGESIYLRYDRAATQDWPITLRVITTRRRLGKYHLLWTKGKLGQGGRAMRLRDIGAELEHVGPSSRRRVLEMASDFEKLGTPALAVLLCWGDGNRRVIVDGCHRASALMLSGAPFRALVVELQPPSGITGAIEDFFPDGVG